MIKRMRIRIEFPCVIIIFNKKTATIFPFNAVLVLSQWYLSCHKSTVHIWGEFMGKTRLSRVKYFISHS